MHLQRCSSRPFPEPQAIKHSSIIGCLHDPANFQQTSSISKRLANAGSLLDRVNTPLNTGQSAGVTARRIHLIIPYGRWRFVALKCVGLCRKELHCLTITRKKCMNRQQTDIPSPLHTYYTRRVVTRPSGAIATLSSLVPSSPCVATITARHCLLTSPSFVHRPSVCPSVRLFVFSCVACVACT